MKKLSRAEDVTFPAPDNSPHTIEFEFEVESRVEANIKLDWDALRDALGAGDSA